MDAIPERRQVVRLFVPHRLGRPELGFWAATLLDLSAKGARILHEDPLEVGAGCVVDFPRALGLVRFPGRVAWTRPYTRKFMAERLGPKAHESGVVFTEMTPEQARGLKAALLVVAAVNAWDVQQSPS